MELSIMQVDGPDNSKHGLIQPGKEPELVAGLIEEPAEKEAPSDLGCILKYLPSAETFNFTSANWYLEATSRIMADREASLQARELFAHARFEVPST